jgi:hypothetical protein
MLQQNDKSDNFFYYIFYFYVVHVSKGAATMPKTRKTKGIYRRGKVYWITYMGLDGKQKYESTGSDLKADAELLLAQRRLDVDQGKEPVTRRRTRNYTFQELAEKYLFVCGKSERHRVKESVCPGAMPVFRAGQTVSFQPCAFGRLAI